MVLMCAEGIYQRQKTHPGQVWRANGVKGEGRGEAHFASLEELSFSPSSWTLSRPPVQTLQPPITDT